MEELVNQFWEEFLQETFGINPTLVIFFKDHERFPLHRKRLLKELKTCEVRFKQKFTRERLRSATRDMARLFCQCCLDAQNYKLMTAASKSIIGKEESETLAFEREFNNDAAQDARGRFSRSMEGYGIQEVADRSKALSPKDKSSRRRLS